jgi:hypothetical protein
VVVSGYEFTPSPEKAPETQPASSGGPPQLPPKPPKLIARDLLEPGEPGKRIFVPDYIEVRELAELLGVKPFKVVADVAGVEDIQASRRADRFPNGRNDRSEAWIRGRKDYLKQISLNTCQSILLSRLQRHKSDRPAGH